MTSSVTLLELPEVEVLEQRFRETVLEKRVPLAVWLVGPHSSGKTTVVEQLVARLEHSEELVRKYWRGTFDRKRCFLQSKCSPADSMARVCPPFGAFSHVKEWVDRREWFRRLFANLVKALASLIPGGEAVGRSIEVVMEALGRKRKPGGERRLTKKYHEELVRASQRTPMVLLVENAHVMDEQSVELLESLLRERRFRGMVILEQSLEKTMDGSQEGSLRKLLRMQMLRRVHITPLRSEKVITYLKHRYGVDIIGNEYAARMISVSGGSTSRFMSMLDRLEREGALRLTREGWVLESDPFARVVKTEEEKYLDDVRECLRNDERIDRAESLRLQKLGENLGLQTHTCRELLALGYCELESEFVVQFCARSDALRSIYRVFERRANRECYLEALYGARPGGGVPDEPILYEYPAQLGDEPMVIIRRWPSGDMRTLREFTQSVGIVELLDALWIARKIAEELEKSHRRGIVHGCLRPENILVSGDQTAKDVRVWLIGYGLQLVEGEAGPTSRLAYASGEGRDSEAPDCREDIYALGTVLFEMIAGGMPLNLKNSNATLEEEQVPESVRRCVEQCLQYRTHRYSSYEELLAGLDTAIEEVGGKGNPIPIPVSKPSRKQAAVWIVSLLLVGSGGAWWAYNWATPEVVPHSVAVRDFEYSTGEIPSGTIEYLIRHFLLSKSMDGVVPLPATVSSEVGTPEVEITGSVRPRGSGFDVAVAVRTGGWSEGETFSILGPAELMETGADRIASYLAPKLPYKTEAASGNIKTAILLTRSWDSFRRFLAGEKLWQRLESLEQAQEEFEGAIQVDSSFSLAYVRLAELLAWRQRTNQQVLELARRQAGKLVPLDTLRLASLEAGTSAQQQFYLRKLAELLPFQPRSHYELGEAYFHVANAADAIASYQKALKQDPNYALAFNHMGYCYAYRGEIEHAMAALRRYVQLDSTANAFDSYADGLMFAGHYDSAMVAKTEAFRRDSEAVSTLGLLSQLALLRGQGDTARSYAREYLLRAKNVEDSVDAFSRLAYVAYQARVLDEAQRACEQAEQQLARLHDPDNTAAVRTRWLLGVLASERGARDVLDRQIGWLERSMAERGITEVNYKPILKYCRDLGIRRALLDGNVGGALERVAAMARMKDKLRYWADPMDFCFFSVEYAERLRQRGAVTEAQRLLREAILYNRMYAPLHFTLARVLLDMKRGGEARQAYAEFVALWRDADQDHPWLLEARQAMLTQ